MKILKCFKSIGCNKGGGRYQGKKAQKGKNTEPSQLQTRYKKICKRTMITILKGKY